MAAVVRGKVLVDHLYTAALALQDEPLIRWFKLSDNFELSDNLRRWAEVYRSDGQEAEAKALERKADGPWKR